MATEHDPASVPQQRSAEVQEHFLRLLAVVEHLRSDHGCPWDRQQTPKSLIPYLLEETYEVIESIEADDSQGLKEELGDLLLHILFQGNMAQAAGQFTLADSIEAITSKLIRRHPHVFGNQPVEGSAQVQQRWEAAKQREKGRASLLDGVPRTLPALTRAQRLQEKAASVGFDWETIAPVWAKVSEELAELHAACAAADAPAIEEEFGDLLFSLVNLGRFLRLNAEDALRKGMAKFERRFRGIEEELAGHGRRLEDASLADMEAIWNRLRQQAKQA